MNEYNSPSKTPATQVTHRLELGENAFWVLIWTLAALTLATVLSVALYYGHKEDTLIASSTDPIATACALGTRSTVSNQCTALLARGK